MWKISWWATVCHSWAWTLKQFFKLIFSLQDGEIPAEQLFCHITGLMLCSSSVPSAFYWSGQRQLNVLFLASEVISWCRLPCYVTKILALLSYSRWSQTFERGCLSAQYTCTVSSCIQLLSLDWSLCAVTLRVTIFCKPTLHPKYFSFACDHSFRY